MLKFCLNIFFLIFVNTLLFGQKDTVYLSKNFKFHDGVFMSFEAFKNNEPTYVWDDLEVGIYSNPQNFMAQIHFIELKKEGEVPTEEEWIDMDKIWGIALDGIPYIRLPKEALKKETVVFAGIKLRGKICYYEYEEYVLKKIPISAYNPVTGKPFLTKNVERKVRFIHKNILNFESGESAIFTKENFKKWIQDDSKLLKTVTGLSDSEIEKKLFKCLLIYDDRNLLKITK